MISQTKKAQAFTTLHEKGRPIILHNIWDAGSAKAVADAGAQAIATGSWSVAAAQGYPDGEEIPLDLLIRIVERITATVDLPVSVDIEGGYGRDAGTLQDTIHRVIEAGAIGINFEDQVVGGNSLYAIDEQCTRISAIREAASACDLPLFINARTDLFLQAGNADEHPALLEDAIQRAHAYHDAGASGFFAPGLVDATMIATLCNAAPLPVNIMMSEGAPTIAMLTDAGVARISHGPGPFIRTMQRLREIAAGT